MISQTSVLGTWYRSWIRGKTRIALAWAFALSLALTARTMPHLNGVIIIFAGASLRFWASGYLRKDTRPAIGGPYAWIRNPLYIGTYLMALGACISIDNLWLATALTFIFGLVYHYVVLDEEEKLEEIFGDSYRAYCALVPRFIPIKFPLRQALLEKVNPDARHLSYDFQLAWKNRAYEAYAAALGLVAYIVAFAFIWALNWGQT